MMPRLGGSVGFIHQKVAGLIPSEGKYLGCGFYPPVGQVEEATD